MSVESVSEFFVASELQGLARQLKLPCATLHTTQCASQPLAASGELKRDALDLAAAYAGQCPAHVLGPQYKPLISYRAQARPWLPAPRWRCQRWTWRHVCRPARCSSASPLLPTHKHPHCAGETLAASGELELDALYLAAAHAGQREAHRPLVAAALGAAAARLGYGTLPAYMAVQQLPLVCRWFAGGHSLAGLASLRGLVAPSLAAAGGEPDTYLAAAAAELVPALLVDKRVAELHKMAAALGADRKQLMGVRSQAARRQDLGCMPCSCDLKFLKKIQNLQKYRLLFVKLLFVELLFVKLLFVKLLFVTLYVYRGYACTRPRRNSGVFPGHLVEEVRFASASLNSFMRTNDLLRCLCGEQ